MTIKDFDTKKVILEDQYKSDEYETMTLYFQEILERMDMRTMTGVTLSCLFQILKR